MEYIHWLKRERILILYNEPSPLASESEVGVLDEVEAVRAALETLGINYEIKGVQSLGDVEGALRGTPGLVFNLVESFKEDPLSYCLVPNICESMGWAVTGSSTPALLKTTDKPLCKAILRAHGIPTPDWELIKNGCAFRRLKKAREIILKPAAYHGSEGIDGEKNLISSPYLIEKVIQLAKELGEKFKFGIMAEEFVGDREINVTVLEKDGFVEVLKLAEIDFSGLIQGYPRILDYKAKWDQGSYIHQLTPRIIPAPLSNGISEEIRRIALRCSEVFSCNDYMRVDFRLKGKRIYVIDVNTNPDVSLNGGLAAAIHASGISYETFVLQVLVNAYKRHRSKLAHWI